MKNLLALILLGTGAATAQTITVSQVNTCYYPQGVNNVTVQVPSTSSNSFTWTSTGPNCTDTLLSTSGLMTVFHYKCCGTHTVTCKTSVNGSPSWSATTLVNYHCPPVVTVTSNTSSACAGVGGVLTATAPGAMSYTWYPYGATNYSIAINPLVSTCFTAVVNDMNGCTGSGTSCFSVLPLPVLTVSNGTFCLGSTNIYTASGAQTYAWSNGVSGPTNTISPLGYFTTFTVMGTSANGCISTHTFYVQPDSTCANVWPGDANSDGTVDATDVFELGFYANLTGPARNNASNVYQSQFATSWTGIGSNNQNKAHIDCNGDGTVNASDTVAIVNNFGLNHAFKTSGTSAVDGDITLVPPAYIPNDGSWVKIDIMAGSSTNVLSNLYGIAFDIPVPVGLINTTDFYVSYTPSFLSANNQNIFIRRKTGGVIHCATVRSDKNNVTGNGKIGELHFKAVPGSTGAVTFWALGNQKTDKAGNMTSITSSSVSVQLKPVGLAELEMLNSVQVYPNPANDQITISSSAGSALEYQLTDISGRVLLTGSFIKETAVMLSELNTGVYFLELSSQDKKVTRKLIVE